MNRVRLEEDNLNFDFIDFLNAEKFDDDNKNAKGLFPVDFIAENTEYMYFIEVKDFQHPKATTQRRMEDYEMLTGKDVKGNSIFAIKMGGKIKDSLLRKFASGYKFTKDVIYLLFINLDNLGTYERGRLKEKINNGYIPVGLDDGRFCEFTRISFDLVNAEQLKKYGITCTANKNTV